MDSPTAARRTPTPSRFLCWLILPLLTLATTGCTIGPTVEVRHILVHPGQPLRVLENTTVRGERLDGGGVAEHDVGGWVMMPPSHWAEVERVIRSTIKQPEPAAPAAPGR